MKFGDIEKIEHECVYEVEVEVAHLNEDNVMKPHSYQVLFAQMVERHLAEFEASMPYTMKYGLAWALISLSFEIINPIRGCTKLRGSTWYSRRRGPYFQRDFVFRNEEGETMFHGTSFSVLLQLENRNVFRKKLVPFHMDPPYEVHFMEAEPGFKGDYTFTDVEERTVYNSYIDCLGHVNNCRYGEFAYDAMTDEEKANLINLSRMDVYFISEMRNKDVFTMQRDRKSTRLNSSHLKLSRMPSSA